LIDADPLLRMYVQRMVEEVPATRAYRQRHLRSVEQPLQLINAVLTWGFTSWNDFFTRRFRPGFRPVAAPDDDAVIVSACEATPYALTASVRRTDRFWVKSEPASWPRSSDDPALGLVAFVPIGMSDVSSCLLQPDLVPGHHVAKGDELGRLQYGGSNYCLLFRPGAVAEFALDALPRPHDPEPPLLRVGAALARATRR
jgi:phosphatidylserine decarboxylase